MPLLHEETRTPPQVPSDEAKAEQLRLAEEQGDAYGRALGLMTHKVAHGGQTRAGEYLVGWAVEEAEGMYVPQGGKLVWQEPQEENAHVEISVRDGADGRFLPGLTVHATLLDPDGNEVGTHLQPFLWHPWIFHYGRNWRVPCDGKYTLRVRIDMPNFPRHDKRNGCRYTEPVEVEFTGVQIQRGCKQSHGEPPK